jgi:hypothetical protein
VSKKTSEGAAFRANQSSAVLIGLALCWPPLRRWGRVDGTAEVAGTRSTQGSGLAPVFEGAAFGERTRQKADGLPPYPGQERGPQVDRKLLAKARQPVMKVVETKPSVCPSRDADAQNG